MNIIRDIKTFYKTHYILTCFINIFYKYITYFLCVLYLIWFPIYIIKTNNLHSFSNENITNMALIIYSFYKINSILINKYNFTTEIIFESLFLISAIYDINNSNHIHHIEYCIMCSIFISVFILVYGTFYYIVKSDFTIYYDPDDEDIYLENIADICCEV